MTMTVGRITFTPGPWRYMLDSAGEYLAVFAMPHARPKVICPVKVTDEADARLIAAAPDLLKAVTDALHGFEELQRVLRAALERGGDRFDTSDMLTALQKNNIEPLRAAIAKAEGR
jgi:hypothetical protein